MTAFELPLEERIVQLFQHLGVQKAHFAGRMLQDWKGIVTTHPDMIASLTLVSPMDIDGSVLPPIAPKLCIINGDGGRYAENVANVTKELPEATLVALSDFTGQIWTDITAERTDETLAAMTNFVGRFDDAPEHPGPQLAEGEGEYAGISYRVRGAGPLLVLMPLALAPSQWEPLIPALSQQFCTITLSGSELGFPAILESRGRSLGFTAMLRNLIEEMDVQPGEEVLDIGCGTGVIDRLVARHTHGQNTITGVDMSPYLVQEATALAAKEGVGALIQFKEGNAEDLPFPDNSFDATISCTVLEEGDADKMLSEMVRVTRSGGKIGVIVRGMDMSWWVNLPLGTELKNKVNAPRGSGGAPVCDDSSLYSRVQQLGLNDVKMFPYIAAFRGLIAEYYLERTYLRLNSDEASEWREAQAKAETEGTYFIAQPFHCAIGIKP